MKSVHVEASFPVPRASNLTMQPKHQRKSTDHLAARRVASLITAALHTTENGRFGSCW